jgi:hypothetical protein
LELLLELETMVVDEFGQGEPSDLTGVGEPAGLHKAFDLFGELVWDFDFQGFHVDLLTSGEV